jgi:hypothetical protein
MPFSKEKERFVTTLTDAEKMSIRAVASGDKTQVGAATLAYERAITIHGSDACLELEFMRELLAPVPDLILRAQYRAALRALTAPVKADTVQTPAIPDDLKEVVTSAGALIRDRLDEVDVHPCDAHSDEVRGRRLSAPDRRLYDALAAINAIPAAR